MMRNYYEFDALSNFAQRQPSAVVPPRIPGLYIQTDTASFASPSYGGGSSAKNARCGMGVHRRGSALPIPIARSCQNQRRRTVSSFQPERISNYDQLSSYRPSRSHNESYLISTGQHRSKNYVDLDFDDNLTSCTSGSNELVPDVIANTRSAPLSSSRSSESAEDAQLHRLSRYISNSSTHVCIG